VSIGTVHVDFDGPIRNEAMKDFSAYFGGIANDNERETVTLQVGPKVH